MVLLGRLCCRFLRGGSCGWRRSDLLEGKAGGVELEDQIYSCGIKLE